MSKSHSRRPPHIQAEKPPAPPSDEAPPPLPAAVEHGWRPGYRIALLIWLAGFIALLLWLVIDLLIGLWRR
jgi:hypothetical protein